MKPREVLKLAGFVLAALVITLILRIILGDPALRQAPTPADKVCQIVDPRLTARDVTIQGDSLSFQCGRAGGKPDATVVVHVDKIVR
jgi:hypothetical protein